MCFLGPQQLVQVDKTSAFCQQQWEVSLISIGQCKAAGKHISYHSQASHAMEDCRL